MNTTKKVSPEVHVVSHKVDQHVGQDARFECRIRAYPLNRFYWMKNDRIIDNSVISAEHAGAQQTHSASANGNSLIEKKTSKYETIVYHQNNNNYLTVVALVIKVR